ncbi:hypothetical protein [Streptomyces sp. CC228A]|uniref:hypothetical protein n=1 Tax=Streptomyces sp. CC228A TaxID=2898186 RepID=UPI001F218284|nr:hypothetical protein [Streptomyces sp. CC228A]
MTARTLEQVRADAERAGQTGECELGEHRQCHPQDVYATDRPRPGERPLFSVTCTCTCHERTRP